MQKVSESHRLRFIFAPLLLAILNACSKNEPITVASHVWLGYEPMFMARSLGWLDESLVRLKETASASQSMDALKAGQVDAAALTLDEVLRLREAGLDLRVILIFNISAGADMILARSPMDHLSELAGLSVGYEHGAVGELMITEALDRAGLERNQIESLDLALDEHLDAWRDGVVDVLVTYEPVAGLLLNQGAVNIFDSTEMPEIIIDVLAVRADRIGAGESAALEHLVATHLRTLDYFKHNPQDSSYRMAERLELPAGEVLPAYHGLVLPDLTNNYRLLQGDHSALADHLKRRLDFKAHPGAADGRARLDDLFSARFLPPPASP